VAHHHVGGNDQGDEGNFAVRCFKSCRSMPGDVQVDNKETASPRAAMHAVTFATTIAHASQVAAQSSGGMLVGRDLPNVPEALSRRLKGVRLGWVLELVANSTGAAEILARIRSAASEESRVSLRMRGLCETVAVLDVRLSLQRVQGCCIFVNLPDLLHDVQVNLGHLLDMHSNTGMVNLTQQYEESEAVLCHTEKVLAAAEDCQDLWLRLSNAFHNDQVRALASPQFELLKEAQTKWRIMQVKVQDHGGKLAPCAAVGGPLGECIDISALLRTVHQQLGHVYAHVRKTFARMHLLSDAEVLLTLAESKPAGLPASVIQRCFPGVRGLVTDMHHKQSDMAQDSAASTSVVTAIQGHCGEQMILANAVEATYVPAYEWLAHLEVAIRHSLRLQTYQAIHDVAQLPEDAWHVSYPQQSICLAMCLAFTRATEQALCADAQGSKSSAVRSLAEQMHLRLETISQRLAGSAPVFGPTSSAKLRALTALALMAITQRDVADLLFKKDVRSPADWTWLSTLRYSWPDDCSGLRISVGDATITYGWEYQSTCSLTMNHLLIHSDEAAATACMALRHNSVVAFAPAAESIGVQVDKLAASMADVFGRMIMTLDCTTHTTSKQLQRFLQVSLS
jgi:Dynein heavy chain, N-terminal region 2